MISEHVYLTKDNGDIADVHRERVQTSVNSSIQHTSMEAITPVSIVDLPSTLDDPPPYIDSVELEITNALMLDLSMYPRYNRTDTSTNIPLNKSNHSTSKKKLILLANAARWGYNAHDCTFG